jgi:hypothetical protein
MGYFPNSCAGDWYESQYCNKCAHQNTPEDEGCPIWNAHILWAYELCNESEHIGKHILDLLIPIAENGVDMEKCTMFQPKNGVTEKHLRDWEKYKAIMAEASGERSQGQPS